MSFFFNRRNFTRRFGPTGAAASGSTTVRTSANATSASATSLTSGTVTGQATGDLLIAILSVNGGGTETFSDNNGATAMTKDYEKFQVPTGSGMAVFSRRVQSGDPTTWSFTQSGSANRFTMVVICFQNPNVGTIYDIAPADGNTNVETAVGGTTGISLGITTATNNALHIPVTSPDNGGVTITGTPAGYTIPQNLGNQPIAVGYKVITTASATGDQTWTYSITIGSRISLSFAIKDISS